MLNQLFHGSVGFAWGVRAQAFLVFGLLAAANCLMSRPAQWHVRPDVPRAKLLAILKDVPYLLMILGYVFCQVGRNFLAHVFYEKLQLYRAWVLFSL